MDEKKHMKRLMPVTKVTPMMPRACDLNVIYSFFSFYWIQDQVDAYKERLKLINAAPIKKIAEAKARKKRKVCLQSFQLFYKKIIDFMPFLIVDD